MVNIPIQLIMCISIFIKYKTWSDMKIFISYRRAEDNKSFIVGTIHEKIAKVFGKENVFRDTYNIHAGTNWRDVLGREINTCKVMLVIIGPDWANLTGANGKKRLFDHNDVT